MAANKIISRIEEEASKENAAILAAAGEKAKAQGERIIAEAKAQVEQINVQAKSEAEEAGRRQILIAELESRKKTLDAKRGVMEQVFAKVEEELGKLPQDKWETLITSIVLNASETGREVLHVPAADMDKYKNGMLSKLNAALMAAGRPGELTLSAEPAKFKGGVTLEGISTDFDGSFSSILKDVRSTEERNVAEILFGVGVK